MVTKIPESHLANFYYGTTDPTGTTRINIDADLHATKFTGDLIGNASTSTKATQDGSGNIITSYYSSTTHTHGNITLDGKIGSTSGLIIKTTTNGVLTALAAGTSGQYLQYDGTWSTPPNSPDTNYYPTTFTWSNGTTAGPTGSLTGTGMSAVSYGAIPSASGTVSGVVTTGDQTFAGAKTFTSNIIGNITGNVSGSSGSCTGNAATSSSTSAIAGISTYTGTTDPTGTTRVNIDGYVYATKVYNAVYNDYAECFNNDKLVYRDVRNRIVELDDNGNTVLATENSTNVIGVVSDSYGHMLGGTEEDIICSNKLPIGLAGVLYVDVIEPVDIKNKGKFVVSAGDGYAKVDENPKLGTIVGKIIGIDELINRYKIIITLV